VTGRAASDIEELDLTLQGVLDIIAEAISDKKGSSPVFLDLTDVVDYVDVICIASGETSLQNRAIADRVTERLESYDIIPDSLQGYDDGSWILLDYGVIVVHAMLPELRSFYQLEELWSEGRLIAV